MSFKSVLYFIFVFDISFRISVKVVDNKNNESLVFSFIVEYIDSLQGSLIYIYIYIYIYIRILLFRPNFLLRFRIITFSYYSVVVDIIIFESQ